MTDSRLGEFSEERVQVPDTRVGVWVERDAGDGGGQSLGQSLRQSGVERLTERTESGRNWSALRPCLQTSPWRQGISSKA